MATATAKKREQEELEYVEQSIKQWTGQTEEQYRMLIFESGIEFLQHMEGQHEEEYFMVLSKHKGFWNWWKLKWFSRDRSFVATVLYNHKHLKELALLNVYQRWHGLPKLVQDTPIEQSYYRMLHLIKFTKEK